MEDKTKMDEQEKLQIGIGTKEAEKLEAVEVEIQGSKVQDVMKNDKKLGEKVVLICKHPKKEEVLQISQVIYLKNKKVITSGIWLNLDEDGLIQKNSVLAFLLNFYEVPKVGELTGKKVKTEHDDNGYLCIKAY